MYIIFEVDLSPQTKRLHSCGGSDQGMEVVLIEILLYLAIMLVVVHLNFLKNENVQISDHFLDHTVFIFFNFNIITS